MCDLSCETNAFVPKEMSVISEYRFIQRSRRVVELEVELMVGLVVGQVVDKVVDKEVDEE